tara:strand:+ start:73 stop:231 length:159 start_codon:yes stop_codon:yes gene_type:complete
MLDEAALNVRGDQREVAFLCTSSRNTAAFEGSVGDNKISSDIKVKALAGRRD